MTNIVLTKAEIQSNYDRVKWAEGLILQLPAEHDGRNSWLLNYGRGDEAQAKRKARKLEFNEQSQAINPPSDPPPSGGGERVNLSGTDFMPMDQVREIDRSLTAAPSAPASGGGQGNGASDDVAEFRAMKREWPHDEPQGWNLDAAKFIALVQSQPSMWLCLMRAKYIELRIDTRDGGFNLYDRDRNPLNPDDVANAVIAATKKYGEPAPPPEAGPVTVLRNKLKSLHWHIVNNTVNKEIIVGLIEDALRLVPALRTTPKGDDGGMRAAFLGATAALAAAISLLERGGKKAAPSDKMFAQMLVDYNKALDAARAALAEAEATGEVCPNCNDANQYGDYEGPTCQVCGGTGRIAAPSAPASGGEPV